MIKKNIYLFIFTRLKLYFIYNPQKILEKSRNASQIALFWPKMKNERVRNWFNRENLQEITKKQDRDYGITLKNNKKIIIE